MDEPTSRHRAPLIPSISTIDQEKPLDVVKPEAKEGQTVCVVVIAVIDVGSEPDDRKTR